MSFKVRFSILTRLLSVTTTQRIAARNFTSKFAPKTRQSIFNSNSLAFSQRCLYGEMGHRRYIHDIFKSDNMRDKDTVMFRDKDTVDIQELRNAIEHNAAYIVDVRDANEVRKEGHISSKRWINIPCNKIGKIFRLSEEEFERKVGSVKPTTTDNMIFYCKSGKRSKLALAAALQLGFTKAKHFQGGWTEWEENEDNST